MGLWSQVGDDSLVRYIYDDSSFAQDSRNNIFSLAATPDSNIYVGSPVGLTLHEDLNTSNDSLITVSALPDSLVAVLLADSAGANQVWGASDSLVWLWDGSLSVTYDADSGLIGKVIHDFAIDSVGALWITTNFGVSRFWEGYWIDYTTINSGLIDNEVFAVAVSGKDSSIWFGSSGGLIQFDGDTTWTDHTDSLSSPNVRDIIYSASDTTLWVATDSGLTGYMVTAAFPFSWWTRLYPGNTNDSLSHFNLFSVQADSGGRVWVGHSTGVDRFVQN